MRSRRATSSTATRTGATSRASSARADLGSERRLAGGRLDRRQPHDEARARLGLLDADAAAVALGHRAHDRQAQPERLPVVAGPADEALEDALAQLGRDARPAILDDEHRLAGAAP